MQLEPVGDLRGIDAGLQKRQAEVEGLDGRLDDRCHLRFAGGKGRECRDGCVTLEQRLPRPLEHQNTGLANGKVPASPHPPDLVFTLAKVGTVVDADDDRDLRRRRRAYERRLYRDRMGAGSQESHCQERDQQTRSTLHPLPPLPAMTTDDAWSPGATVYRGA